jgi:sRNA-binding protein
MALRREDARRLDLAVQLCGCLDALRIVESDRRAAVREFEHNGAVVAARRAGHDGRAPGKRFVLVLEVVPLNSPRRSIPRRLSRTRDHRFSSLGNVI